VVKILALDLATRFGWCAGDGQALPEVGYVDLPPASGNIRGPMFLALRRWLIAKIRELRADGSDLAMVFEQPIMPKPFLKAGQIIMPTSINTTLTLQGLVAIAQGVAEEAGLIYGHVDVSSVKKELAGFGGAAKADMVFVARKVGLTIAVHDEADAFGVWLVGLRTHNRPASAKFDQMIWGARGALI
jgi:hypothetical protein